MAAVMGPSTLGHLGERDFAIRAKRRRQNHGGRAGGDGQTNFGEGGHQGHADHAAANPQQARGPMPTVATAGKRTWSVVSWPLDWSLGRMTFTIVLTTSASMNTPKTKPNCLGSSNWLLSHTPHKMKSTVVGANHCTSSFRTRPPLWCRRAAGNGDKHVHQHGGPLGEVLIAADHVHDDGNHHHRAADAQEPAHKPRAEAGGHQDELIHKIHAEPSRPFVESQSHAADVF